MWTLKKERKCKKKKTAISILCNLCADEPQKEFDTPLFNLLSVTLPCSQPHREHLFLRVREDVVVMQPRRYLLAHGTKPSKMKPAN